MDIVKELRARAFQGRFNIEAAEEIERLREELAESQAERYEQARLLSMSAERELALVAELEDCVGQIKNMKEINKGRLKASQLLVSTKRKT